ncbi:MAG: outer membrane lipoprotein LolB [Sutterellaceae bacterium]|nr:outer membrane lipoprotein LolB [Sutterellaceae bacterium]
MQTNRRTLLTASLSLALLALSGCSTLPKDTTQYFSGRFSGKFERGGKTESLSGRYRYRVGAQTSTLDLMTPLYGILAQVEIDAKGARLLKGEEVVASAASAQDLMHKTVGLALPVEMLQNWLTGRPQYETRFVYVDENTFEQAGWRIVVRRRHEDGSAAVVAATALQSLYAGTTVTLTVDKE